MGAPIRFYFDFASPYAYFAADKVEAIGKEFGRTVEWKPVLMWAVLRAQGIVMPMDSPAKRAYLLNDMKRSAAFLDVPYVHPERLPLSAHRASRLYYGVDEGKRRALAHALFRAFFLEEQDIADEQVLLRLAGELGLDEAAALQAMDGAEARSRLEQAVQEAVGDGVIGSPFFLLDGEGFFGADRLAQLHWHLARSNP